MFVPYLLDVICILVSEFMTVYNYYQFVRTYVLGQLEVCNFMHTYA